jgi:hypothetical protein
VASDIERTLRIFYHPFFTYTIQYAEAQSFQATQRTLPRAGVPPVFFEYVGTYSPHASLARTISPTLTLCG